MGRRGLRGKVLEITFQVCVRRDVELNQQESQQWERKIMRLNGE